MSTAAVLFDASLDALWRVSRDGDVVAQIDVRQEGGNVVVSADTAGEAKPYRFETLQSADAFIKDLMTSFAYLGCDVAKVTG
jgi:hypothetical protein